jgi:hypothetical protein
MSNSTAVTDHADVMSAAIAQQLGCDRVMSFPTWCVLAGVSLTTGKRLVASGRGPKLTHMSERCIGVRVSHHHEWLDACSNNNAENETLAGG